MVKYKNFKIGDIFNITTGRDVIISDTKNGEIPLISHQHDNNGITKYIKKLENRTLYNHKNTIALADRGVFLATTQKEDFHIGTRVKALTFKNGEQSEKVRLFFVTAINKLQILFKEYLTNATDKLPNLTIMLPVDEKDNIDYLYMENYIDELEKQSIKEMENYLEESFLNDYKLTEDEKKALSNYKNKKLKYKDFIISSLFLAENGDVDIQQKHINNKGLFVISSGEQNNGIIGKSDINSKVFNENTLTVDMFGNCYFREFKYKMVTHARVFSLKYKNRALTVEEGIFLSTQLNYLKKVFSYSNMASWEKIKNRIISLPVNEADEIDFKFINNFIKAQEKELLRNLSNL